MKNLCLGVLLTIAVQFAFIAVVWPFNDFYCLDWMEGKAINEYRKVGGSPESKCTKLLICVSQENWQPKYKEGVIFDHPTKEGDRRCIVVTYRKGEQSDKLFETLLKAMGDDK